jgi:(E)-4-hydroxy-3-methyl-but-2-enyl pyrophosphate reductase
MVTIDIRKNVELIRNSIEEGAAKSGRQAHEIKLIAITKNHAVEEMVTAIRDAGIMYIGENRVQEAQTKICSWPEEVQAQWHLVGHLQRNKARKALEIFHTIQSLESESLAEIGKTAKLGVISQTTQDSKVFAAIVSELALRTQEMRVYNTICNATRERQDATRKLAQFVDGIIVVGGRNSANTGKLYDIARFSGIDVVWIEHAEELDRRWLSGKARVGITAGASTPDWLISQLKNTLSSRR